MMQPLLTATQVDAPSASATGRDRRLSIDDARRDFDLRALVLRLIASGAQKYGRQWHTAGKAISKQWFYDQILFGDAIA